MDTFSLDYDLFLIEFLQDLKYFFKSIQVNV